MKEKNRGKLIIFDLDGTLYELPGGSYNKSPLRRRVLANAQVYIAAKLSKTKSEARSIFAVVQKKYGEQISTGLEKDFGFSRYDYFNNVWDISTRGIVKKNKNLRKILLALRKTYNLALVSDAPQVWIRNVLTALSIQDIFRDSIFSGEGNRRKGFSNAFSNIIRSYKIRPADCIAVGDQEETDIIPAKKIGTKTIFVHRSKHSRIADANIRTIRNLPAVLKTLSFV